MSQYGALGKALKGANAAAILRSYYGAARLTRLPPERLPATIKVALEPVRPSLAVGGPGRFRLTDANGGKVVAVAATGAWQVRTGPGGKLRVVPPPGQDKAPVLEPLGYEPHHPAPGSPVVVRIRLSAPAMVGARVDGPGGPTPAAPGPHLMEAGEWPLTLTPPASPGHHVVSIVADAGGDRVATAPLTIAVAGAGGDGRTADGAGGGGPRAAGAGSVVAPGLVALALWAWVSLTGSRRVLRARRAAAA